MTVVVPIGEGLMSPTVVGVDEVVGEDDVDVGDELVLDKDEGGARTAMATTGVAAAAVEEERNWWTGSYGCYGGISDGS